MPTNKAAKPPKSVTGLTLPRVMLMAEIRALNQTDRIARFGERASVAQRAFAEMGKLRRAIEADLKPNQDITNTLRKAGVRDGTISNTSYAARVFDLVEAGHITEAQYDTFTFADCLAICRAMGAQSKLRLDGAQVAVVLAEDPKHFDRELTCIYEHGTTVADKAEADKKAAAAEKAAAAKAEKERIEAEAAKLVAGKTAPASTAPPAPDGKAAPDASATDPAGAAIEVESVAEAPHAPPNVIESGITPPQPAAGKSKLQQTLNLLDALELMFADLTIDEARKAAPRLAELTNTVMEFVASTPAEEKAVVVALKADKAAKKHAKKAA